MSGVPGLPPFVLIAGLPVVPLDRGELIDALLSRAILGVPTTVHYLNAHVFNLVRRDPALKTRLAGCDLLYADGISIVWAARAMGFTAPARLTAADYFREFCLGCANRKLSLFLVGGAAGTAQVAAERLQREIAHLHIVGTSHGYLSAAESRRLAARVADSGADVLIVGMGSPRQEHWIAEYGPHTRATVQWSVGALMDYFAGVETRCPAWMCRMHGEWLYRLLVRPRQRWQRYLLGNLQFAGGCVRDWLQPSRATPATHIGPSP